MSLLEHRSHPLDEDVARPPIELDDAPLKLVDPDAWRARRRMRLAMGAVGVFVVVAAFATVALRVMIAQQQYQLQRLGVAQQQSQRRNADLRARVTELSSGARIVAEAEKAGLEFPQIVRIVPLPRDTPEPRTPTVPSALADYGDTKPTLVTPAP